jgi:hypothetical protein
MKIIAYGSLMNRSSLESVLCRPAPLSKITVSGWRRIFNAPFDGYAYLNLAASPGGTIEAAYFELDPADLGLFAEREAGAELVEVVPEFHAFVWPESDCRELPALRSYMEVCSRAAGDLGINFAAGLDWPQAVVDDTENPQYDMLYWAQELDRPAGSP